MTDSIDTEEQARPHAGEGKLRAVQGYAQRKDDTDRRIRAFSEYLLAAQKIVEDHTDNNGQDQCVKRSVYGRYIYGNECSNTDNQQAGNVFLVLHDVLSLPQNGTSRNNILSDDRQSADP